ncbi:MAG: alpha/beta hydrolase [Candidatus Velthaea sp.]
MERESRIADWDVPHDLRAYREVPANPIASVLVLHGYAEHAARHAATMRRFARAGMAAYSYDHRGHGRSPGARALVERFDHLVRDSLVMRDFVRGEQPDLPSFLFGASMGGLIATRSAQLRADDLCGVVLVAPALTIGQNESVMVRTIGRVIGEFAPQMPIAALDPSRLSRTASVGPAFLADELTHHGKVPARTAAEMVKAGEAAFAQAAAWRLPLLIVHGSADRICAPSGSRRFASALVNADVTLREIDGGYHEPLSDPGGNEVLDDMIAWMRARAIP